MDMTQKKKRRKGREKKKRKKKVGMVGGRCRYLSKAVGRSDRQSESGGGGVVR